MHLSVQKIRRYLAAIGIRALRARVITSLTSDFADDVLERMLKEAMINAIVDWMASVEEEDADVSKTYVILDSQHLQ
jgi:hypothetical protein